MLRYLFEINVKNVINNDYFQPETGESAVFTGEGTFVL